MPDNNPPKLDISAVSTGHAHLIEANAGTGKTYAIANLFLRFILEGREIDAILVVTFTNAARDELRGRLRRRLAEALHLFQTGKIDNNEDEFFSSLLNSYDTNQSILRLEHALLSMNEAAIHTIHGFCQQALTEQAFSSGQTFDLEQTDNKPIREQAILDWWRNNTYNLDPDELQDFQETRFSNKENFSDIISPLLPANAPKIYIADSENNTPLDKLDTLWNEAFEKLRSEWKSNETDICERLTNRKRYKLTKTGAAYNDKGVAHFISLMQGKIKSEEEMPGIQNDPRKWLNPYSYCNIIKKLNQGGEENDFDLSFFHLIDELNENLTDLHLQYITEEQRLLQEKLAKELEGARNDIRTTMADYKLAQGLMSFDDMIERLHRATMSNSKLATQLGKRYPIIMVDEFQDTDAQQYDIFHRLHKAGGDDHTFIMIGDPKQAIYAFRGGDIFTYMLASTRDNQRWTLSTNWRSTPGMIEAVNKLFSCANPFAYEEIPYHRSSSPLELDSPRECKARPLMRGQREQPAMVFEAIPETELDELPSSKKAAYPLIHELTAARIAELLNDNTASIDGKPLQAGDIAVLVREKDEASSLQKQLLDYGIRAVSLSNDSVWNSDEANSLLSLATAIVTPRAQQPARQALASPILNLDLKELHDIQTQPELWSDWVEMLHSLNQLWREQGFMSAYQHLLRELETIIDKLTKRDNASNKLRWLARSDNPERLLTNLGHLAELIQQASLEHPGMESVLIWMQHQKEKKDSGNEELQLRLESDENLVKMVTLHSAKGLQYPVVFLPYLWHGKPVDNKSNTNIRMKWHEKNDNGYTHWYTPKGTVNHSAFPLAERERLAEDIRLAYVALTRAESYCHVIFGPMQRNGKFKGHPGRTGLAWLLRPEDNEIDLNEQAFEIPPEDISIRKLPALSKHISLMERKAEPAQGSIQEKDKTSEARCENFTRNMFNNWTVKSFSSLTEDIHQPTQVRQGTGESYALQFAASANVGSFLHALLERIDTTQELKPQLLPLIRYYNSKFNLDLDPEVELDDISNWLQDVLKTPLNEDNLSLGSIDAAHQIHELEFDFSTHRVGNNMLHDCLIKHMDTDATLEKVAFTTFEGMITGSIDLTFEHGGKYYIADYKSNRIGYRMDDYKPERLETEIFNRRYDLQYLLYTLALHRHLKNRIANYSYERDFGGVYYLFLRAMTPDTGIKRGIFHTKPPFELIRELDEQVFSMPEVSA